MLMPAPAWLWLLYLSCLAGAIAWIIGVPPDLSDWSPTRLLIWLLALALAWRLFAVAGDRTRLDAWGDGLMLRLERWAGVGLMGAAVGSAAWSLAQNPAVLQQAGWAAVAGLLLFEASRLAGFEAIEAARRAGSASSILATSQAPGLAGMVSVPPAPPPPPPRGHSVGQGVAVRVTPLPPEIHVLLHKHGLVLPGQASSNCARAVLGLKGQGLAYAAADLHLHNGSVIAHALLRHGTTYHDPSGESSHPDVREVRVRKGFDAHALTRALTQHFGKGRAVEMLRSGEPLPPLVHRGEGRYSFDA